MVELEIKSEKKLHEASLKKFLSGSFGKIYRREILDRLITVMNESGAATLEMKNHFFDPGMEYEDGDVEIFVSLKLKKIGEEEAAGDD